MHPKGASTTVKRWPLSLCSKASYKPFRPVLWPLGSVQGSVQKLLQRPTSSEAKEPSPAQWCRTHYICFASYVPVNVNKIIWGSVLFHSSFCELQKEEALLKATQTCRALNERPRWEVGLSLLMAGWVPEIMYTLHLKTWKTLVKIVIIKGLSTVFCPPRHLEMIF